MSESSLQIPAPFSQGVGYGLVVGLGMAFAVGMSALSWFLARYFAERQSSGNSSFPLVDEARRNL
jgi:urea-proton symporter